MLQYFEIGHLLKILMASQIFIGKGLAYTAYTLACGY